MKLPANHNGLEDANAALLTKRRKAQTSLGWVHLLSDPDNPDDRSCPGCVLWQRECMVLSFLRDEGPKTREQILDMLGMPRAVVYSRSVFSVLIDRGLVEVIQENGLTLFALSAAATPPERWRDTKYG